MRDHRQPETAPGNLSVVERRLFRPVTLRPRLSVGLALYEASKSPVGSANSLVVQHTPHSPTATMHFVTNPVFSYRGSCYTHTDERRLSAAGGAIFSGL